MICQSNEKVFWNWFVTCYAVCTKNITIDKLWHYKCKRKIWVCFRFDLSDIVRQKTLHVLKISVRIDMKLQGCWYVFCPHPQKKIHMWYFIFFSNTLDDKHANCVLCGSRLNPISPSKSPFPSLKLQDKNLAFLPLHFLESLLQQQQRETFMNANVVIIKLSVHFPPPAAPLDWLQLSTWVHVLSSRFFPKWRFFTNSCSHALLCRVEAR